MSRRLARQVAFQTLFQIDLASSDVMRPGTEITDIELDEENRVCRKSGARVTEQQRAIDNQIAAVSKGCMYTALVLWTGYTAVGYL